MKSVKETIWRYLHSQEAIRYLIAGVGTTTVNFTVFALCRYVCHRGLNASNFAAIMCSIVFAFFANKYYTFRSKTRGADTVLTEFLQFAGARMITMLIELVGVDVMVVWFGLPDMLSKLLIQVIVVVANFVVSKVLVFGHLKSRTAREWALANAVYIVSFLIPAGIFLAICVRFHVTPFGDQTLMIVDSLHQYLPYFSEYYDKLKDSGEFLYSWNGALGFNFVTLWSYYLSSPFNLLILLFPKIQINTAMTLIIGCKISCCSLAMTYLLAKSSSVRDLRAVFCGLCYAYSSYVIGYYWNIMWLDVLILTPLVVLGLNRLLNDKDARLYIVTLFASLFCNFYISFMLCLFLVLWFFIYPHKSVKTFFASGVRFACASLLAAGMAAAILIPTYVGIMLTGPADSEFPESSWYGSMLDIVKKFCFMAGSITNQSDDGGVNLYCGVVIVFLAVQYFFIKEISLGQKLKRVLLIVFLLLSFNNTLLNYIWHGFHDQFGIPNRFSFLLIFLLITMAYETIMHIETLSFWSYLAPMVVLVALIVCNNMQEPLFDDESVIKWTMVLYILYFSLFMLHLMLEWRTRTLAVLLTMVVVMELGFNAFFGFEDNGQITIADYFSDSNAMWAAAESVKDGSFYREELSKNGLVDENFWLNLKSVGIFGSTANGDAVTLLGKLGYYTAANEYLYNGATPLTDMLMGVRYLYKRDGDYFDHGFDYLKTIEGVDIYENPYALSMGYMIDDAIADWEYEQYQPADVCNDFCRKAAGVDAELFSELPDVFEGSGTCCDVTYNEAGDGTYAYSRTEDGDLTVTLSFTATSDEPIYIRATGTDLSGIRITVNDEVVCDGRYFFQLVPVNNQAAGDKITVTYDFTGSEADDQTVNLKAYTFDKSVFAAVYDALSDEQLQIENATSDTIEGEITVQKDGVFMTSIINEPGWHVSVDGEEVDVEEIGDVFVSVALTQGTHKIKLWFVPQSLALAIGLSAASFAVFIIYLWMRKRQWGEYLRRRREQKKLFQTADETL